MMVSIFDLLFGSYPREFGKNRTFIKTKEQALSTIDTLNRKTNCWMTVHKLEKKRDYSSVTVEKLFFDLDKEDAFEKSKIFHEFLLNKNLRHVILFSGNGFHFYVFTIPIHRNSGVKSIKNAVRNAQLSLIKEAELTVGDPNKCDFDSHVIGDISRISRIPNTLNLNCQDEKRYCIPLCEEDMYSSIYEIREKSKKQVYEYELFQVNKKGWDTEFVVDLKKYDTDPIFLENDGHDNINISDLEMSRILNDESFVRYETILKKLPHLIRHLLETRSDGYRDRYLTILAFREIGVPIEITIKICKVFWKKEKFHHAIVSEKNQFQYIYNRTDLFFPNWKTLEREGYQINEEDRKFNFYK